MVSYSAERSFASTNVSSNSCWMQLSPSAEHSLGVRPRKGHVVTAGDVLGQGACGTGALAKVMGAPCWRIRWSSACCRSARSSVSPSSAATASAGKAATSCESPKSFVGTASGELKASTAAHPSAPAWTECAHPRGKYQTSPAVRRSAAAAPALSTARVKHVPCSTSAHSAASGCQCASLTLPASPRYTARFISASNSGLGAPPGHSSVSSPPRAATSAARWESATENCSPGAGGLPREEPPCLTRACGR
mmetsp:Transcript_35509/g.100021  ORF Transcript_35509/g.100021 Transcript_35509/m.100021 type:complete len:250 (-) Transcript_35509:146-895(-)